MIKIIEKRIDNNRDDIKYNDAQIEKIKLEIKEGKSYNWKILFLLKYHFLLKISFIKTALLQTTSISIFCII